MGARRRGACGLRGPDRERSLRLYSQSNTPHLEAQAEERETSRTRIRVGMAMAVHAAGSRDLHTQALHQLVRRISLAKAWMPLYSLVNPEKLLKFFVLRGKISSV